MALGTAAILAGGALANIGGAVIGSMSAAGDRAKAQEAMQQAYQEIMELGLPPDLSAEIFRQKLQQVGVYTPQLEEAIQVEASKVAQIQEDPKLRNAQVQGLQSLIQRSNQGLTAVERGAFNETRRKAAQDAESRRQQLVQNLAQSGMGGSGPEFAAQLMAAQSGDQELAAQGDRLSAAAAQAALQATAQGSSLAGQIRGQDFNTANTKAQAEDLLNQFAVTNQIARQQRNIASQNQAQQGNLSEQQRIADYNTQQANSEKLRQAEAKRQNYLDTANLAGMKSNALAGQAQQYQKQGDATAAIGQGVGSGIGGAFNAIGAQQQQENFWDKLLNKNKVS